MQVVGPADLVTQFVRELKKRSPRVAAVPGRSRAPGGPSDLPRRRAAIPDDIFATRDSKNRPYPTSWSPPGPALAQPPGMRPSQEGVITLKMTDFRPKMKLPQTAPRLFRRVRRYDVMQLLRRKTVGCVSGLAGVPGDARGRAVDRLGKLHSQTKNRDLL